MWSQGSGKSTLLRLLYRMTDPQSGQVLIDGQDVKTLDLSFRRSLGIVPQDCALFNDTISGGLEWQAMPLRPLCVAGFNIRYARPDAADAEARSLPAVELSSDIAHYTLYIPYIYRIPYIL